MGSQSRTVLSDFTFTFTSRESRQGESTEEGVTATEVKVAGIRTGPKRKLEISIAKDD